MARDRLEEFGYWRSNKQERDASTERERVESLKSKLSKKKRIEKK